MSQVKLQAFVADVTALKRGSRFWAPSINIDGDYAYWQTSVKGLIDWLRGHFLPAQPMTLWEALAHCANTADDRLVKYMPAIERLVACWGRAAAYQNPPAASTEARNKSMWRFARAILGWGAGVPAAMLPDWNVLDQNAANPAGFGVLQGNTYFARVGPIDVTGRGLLLRSGHVPPNNNMGDRSYVVRLALTRQMLEAMRNRTLLDVACGAAIFRAEMEVLYGCQTNGLELNDHLIPPVVANAQQRYVRSMLYVKMLKDRGTYNQMPLPAWSSDLVDNLVTQTPAIINAYGANLPVNGNILDNNAQFLLDAAAIRLGGWDYTTCMYLLCYFTPVQQTTAVINMCSVTNRTLYLYNGSGNGVLTQQLTYDQAQVQAAFPNCRIVVIDNATHHIHMQ